jgi:hypothetical protein
MAQAPQPFQVRLAPDQLWQAINPWFANSSGDQFGLVNITLGQGNEKVERDILAKVGSYGRQIGHLAEALEVVIGLLKDIAPERMASLDQHQKDSLAVALGDVAEVRQIKDKDQAGLSGRQDARNSDWATLERTARSLVQLS